MSKYLKLPRFLSGSQTSNDSLRSQASAFSAHFRRGKMSSVSLAGSRISDRRFVAFPGSSMHSNDSLRLRWPVASADAVKLYLQKNPSFLDDLVKNEIDTNTLVRWLNSKRRSQLRRSSATDVELSVLCPNVEKLLTMMGSLRRHMSYPVQPEIGAADEILRSAALIEENPPPNIDNYKYDSLSVEGRGINSIIMYMMEDLLGHHAFPRDQLANFLAVVGTNYGDVAYHNYNHALCHSQSMYWILKKSQHVFTEVEMKTLMIASVCHDLCHPGLNESFLKSLLSETVTSYARPLLEGFHLHTAELTLMNSDCYLFPETTSKEFEQVIVDIKDCILSTYVSHYNGLIDEVKTFTEKDQFDFNDPECRRTAKCLLMAVSDLASCWKPWEQHLVLVYSLCDELYDQGEKLAVLGMKYPFFMDRKCVERVPQYEIGFLEKLALPLMVASRKVFPCLQIIVEATQCNKRRWIEYLS